LNPKQFVAHTRAAQRIVIIRLVRNSVQERMILYSRDVNG
jgi:hypothetical protein